MVKRHEVSGLCLEKTENLEPYYVKNAWVSLGLDLAFCVIFVSQ